MTGVLLIYPPFGPLTGPSMGVPALASYLQRHDIPVSALDANCELYHWLLSPKNIRKAREYVGNRFQEMNEKPELSYPEIVEYFNLGKAMLNSHTYFQAMLDLLSVMVPMFDDHKAIAIERAVQLVSCQYLPEMIELTGTWPFVFKHHSKYNEFSSESILSMTKEDFFLRPFFEKLLQSSFEGGIPDVVGISVSFQKQMLPAFYLASLVKKLAPETHVVMGGSFISCYLRRIPNPALFDLVDSFCLDDGEEPLLELVRQLSSPAPDLGQVPNLIYRQNREILNNDIAKPLDLESLPIPDYTVFPLDRYPFSSDSKFMYAFYRLSRGCRWGRCTFCRADLSMISDYQQPSIDYLIDSIRAIIEQTGINSFIFGDEEASPIVLEKLCHRLLKENIHIRWIVNTRFDPRLTVERCQLFKKCGCAFIYLGLEAYNDRLLKLINKGTSTKMIDSVLQNMKKAELGAVIYMMVGMPTETEEEAMAGYEKVRQLLDSGLIMHYAYTFFQLFEHTPILRRSEEYGITRIKRQPGFDFDHPILDFESGGMSRKKALLLEIAFNDRVDKSKNRKDEKFLKSIREIPINGKMVPLNFDVISIYNIMKQDPVNQLPLEERFLPFHERLKKAEKRVKPLKNKRL